VVPVVISGIVRDLAIIVIAVQTFILNIFLVILIWQIWRLAKMMQTDVKPIIDDTQETVSTIRGTTTFMSANVVDPVIRTSSKFAGAKRTLQALAEGVRPDPKPVTPVSQPESVPQDGPPSVPPAPDLTAHSGQGPPV
jgi:hypothetical protein